MQTERPMDPPEGGPDDAYDPPETGVGTGGGTYPQPAADPPESTGGGSTTIDSDI